MELNYFKDKIFELLDESSDLEIVDIDTDDLKNIFTVETADGGIFEVECRKLVGHRKIPAIESPVHYTIWGNRKSQCGGADSRIGIGLNIEYKDIPQFWNEAFIPASNEPSSRACTDIWRLPRGSIHRSLLRIHFDAPSACCGVVDYGGNPNLVLEMYGVCFDEEMTGDRRVEIPVSARGDGCLVSKFNVNHHIEVELKMNEMDLTLKNFLPLLQKLCFF